MKVWISIFVFGLWAFSCTTAHSNTVIRLGTIRQITGPQDLDLDGIFAYAINFSTDDPPRKVQGVTFLPDHQAIPGATFLRPQSVTPWQTKPEFGSSADANQLEEILADIRWANAGSGERLRATLVVTNGLEYKLQILISGNTAENRRWDIRVNGKDAVDEITSLGVSPGQTYSQNRATLYTYEFLSTNATVVVEMGNFYGGNDGGDRNPIWQALTLEKLYIPPAPDNVALTTARFFRTQTAAIGAMLALDGKSGVKHTFTLVNGAGDADNGKFSISGTNLFPGSFDFANQLDGTAYSIRVRAVDAADPSRFLEKVLTVSLVASHPPAAIGLDAKSIHALARPGELAALIQVQDPDDFDRQILTLVPGEGDNANHLFTVAGNHLRLAQALPAGLNLARIRLKAVDLAGLSVEASFDLAFVLSKVRINELLAGKLGGITDEGLVLQEWVELHNEQPHWVDLSGFYLSDTRNQLAKWRIPSGSIAPNGFLIVFADGQGVAPPGSTNLHANFALSASGQWVGLVQPDGMTLSSQLDAPEFYPGISYGFGTNGSLGYLIKPTPGSENSAITEVGKNEVRFSIPHGFYAQALNLELSATLPDSIIRYTTDGSRPTASAGTIYTSPISVRPNTTGTTRGTRVIRAVAVSSRAAYAPVQTQTYLFVNGLAGPAIDGVVGQSQLLTTITRHATYGPLLSDALRALPVVSVMLPQGPAAAERLASIEMFDPNQIEPGFQIDCGVHTSGTTSLSSPKLSMVAKFRSEYGRSKLSYPIFARGSMVPEGAATEFKELRLRSHSHDTFYWLGTRENPPVPYGNPPLSRTGDAQLARNVWIDEMQLQMGQPGKHGRQVHLYLNGAYHGIYHVHEHPDDDFLASYYPGNASEFHWTTAAVSGSDHGGGDTWRTSWAAMKGSLGTFTQARRWLDVTNLCDYMVLSFYAGNDWDWSANHNWAAAGPKSIDRGGWKFFQQDSDVSLQDVNANNLDQDVPDGIFSAMMRLSDFRVLFRDRFYKHCFNGGILTRASEIYDARMQEIYVAVVAETARWQPGTTIGTLPWDRDQEWTNEWKYLRNTYFPQRTTKLVQQIKARAGWWPADPPVLNKYGGTVPANFPVTFTSPVGTIYFTADGSDPRLPGGAINPSARKVGNIQDTNSSAIVDRPMVVKSRVFLNGDWSAIVEAFLAPDTIAKASTANLVISELQYHPMEDAQNEFIEFLNTTDEPVDLSDVSIAGAVIFQFPRGTLLAPGERIVVAKDMALFRARYATNSSPYYRDAVRTFGPWDGSLSNSGETIVIQAPDKSTLFSFTYGTSGAWPGRADGNGSSLELSEPARAPSGTLEKSAWLDDPNRWRASSEFFGSPGDPGRGPDPRVVINELMIVPAPGQSQWIEFKNVSSASVDLSGWLLSDSASDYRKYRFPGGSVLQAGGWLVLTEADFNRSGNPANPVPFNFGEDGDDAYLLEAAASGELLKFVDRIEYSSTFGTASLGRFPDGTGPLLWLQSQTTGASNTVPIQGYTAWAAATFPATAPKESIGPMADPDGDGLSNFAEYAFVLSPTRFDVSSLTTTSRPGSQTFSFSYRTRTGADLKYRVETSTDLRTWDNSEREIEILSRIPQPDGSTQVIAGFRPNHEETFSTRFLRLGVNNSAF